MSVQIPFPIPNHGYALNSKMRINLDYIVQQFNQFNTGTATWDTVAIGIANSETGTLTFYNASNAYYWTLKPGTTASGNLTFTLPVAYPSATRQFLRGTTAGVLDWSFLSEKASYTGNLLLYADGSGVLQEVAVGSGNKFLVNSSPPSFYSLLGTTNQITVTPNVGNFTLSTPQDINTTSNVTFNSVQVDGGSATNPGIRVIYSGSATNTGLWSGSGTELNMTVAGATRFSIDSTGLGVATGELRAPILRTTSQIKVSTGGSGIVTIQANSSSGGTYTLTLPIDDGNANDVLQSDGSGGMSWVSVSAAGGATKALDNLASVAINTSLLPSSDNAIDLGSSSKEFRSAYLKTSLIFQETGAGTHTITIQPPSSLSASYILTLPVDDGTSNQVLTTDGSGVLSWSSAGSLSGTVSSGTAGRLALYNTTSTTVGDTYVQNSQNINVAIASHGTLASTRTYTIPDANANATVVLTETNGQLSLNGSYKYTQSLSIIGTVASLEILLSNTSNTAGQKAFLNIAVAGGTADDAYTQYTVSGATDWSSGIDNSDSDKYKISKNSTLGTNDYFVIDTSGNITTTGNIITAGLVEYADGSASAPSIVRSSATTTGFFLISTGFAYAVSGVRKMQYDTSNGITIDVGGINTAGSIILPNGSSGSPALVSADADTGIYFTGSSKQINLGCDGTRMGFFAKTQIDIGDGTWTLEGASGSWYPATDNAISSGQTGQRYTAIWAANGTIQTSVSSTKRDIKPILADSVPLPEAIRFKRLANDPHLGDCEILGFSADNLPKECFAVINPTTGERSTQDVYLGSVVGLILSHLKSVSNQVKELNDRFDKLGAK